MRCVHFSIPPPKHTFLPTGMEVDPPGMVFRATGMDFLWTGMSFDPTGMKVDPPGMTFTLPEWVGFAFYKSIKPPGVSPMACLYSRSY